MKLEGRIKFFIIFISIILLGNFKNVNASLQDQYRAQSCTFNNAPFQDSENETERYCINKVNNRVTLVWDDGDSSVYEGYLGKAELVNNFGTWTIYEWVIDSNKLILYSCVGNSRGCTDEVRKQIVGIKR